IKGAHACCLPVIRVSFSQAFDGGLYGSLCLLILGILRLVLNFSPYRCAKSGSVFRHERKTERGPPLLVNVVRTGPLDGIDTWILSCTSAFLHSSKSMRCLPSSSRPIMAKATELE